MVFQQMFLSSVRLFIVVSCLFFMSCNEPNRAKPIIEDGIKEVEEYGEKEVTKSNSKSILFLGNSLTAAYGLDIEEGYVYLIQEKIDSLELDYVTINGGLSGETSAGGLTRIDWMLKNSPTDIFVLALGGNDGLRGIDPRRTKSNLLQIIQKVRAKTPDAKIVMVGMEAPPNMGQDYTSAFRSVFPDIAREEKTDLIPFLLKDVGGIPDLNQKDGIHPTAEGHKILAETVWKVLYPLMKG